MQTLPQPGQTGQAIHRNDIRLPVSLSTAQANEVGRLLLAAHPALAALRTAGQLQLVNASGQFRIIAVRGGVLPVDVSANDVQALVDAVKAELPDKNAGEPVWYTRQSMAHGRRNR